MTLRRTLILLALATIATPAAAGETVWRVTEAAGKIEVRHGGSLASVNRGSALRAGDVIETAPGARAVLVRGEDYVIVSPATRLRLPEAGEQRGIIQVLEEFGKAVFRIEKKETPHFGVRTPYLVALVKGTVFTVTVDGRGASVAVEEGRVEVATPNGSQRQLVVAGNVGTVAAASPDRLDVAAGTVAVDEGKADRADASTHADASSHSEASSRAEASSKSAGARGERPSAPGEGGKRLSYALGTIADAPGLSRHGGGSAPGTPPGQGVAAEHIPLPKAPPVALPVVQHGAPGSPGHVPGGPGPAPDSPSHAPGTPATPATPAVPANPHSPPGHAPAEPPEHSPHQPSPPGPAKAPAPASTQAPSPAPALPLPPAPTLALDPAPVPAPAPAPAPPPVPAPAPIPAPPPAPAPVPASALRTCVLGLACL